MALVNASIYLRVYIYRTVHQFHGLISECVDMYVRPCLQQRSPDSFLSDCTLAENVFKMILSVCSAGDLLAVAGSVKRWENTVRRVVLLSCIWTVGVCSPTSREPFQEWFATFFRAAMGEQSEEDKIFPTFNMQTTSLFDSSLVCPNDKEVYLEWALFDRITMMEIMDKAPPAAGTNKASYISSEDRLRRSYQDIYYTTLLNQAADKASVLVPTPTGSAWMLLQASLMRTGGVVLVTGAAGSGKSMLMRQMVELSKAVSATRLSQDTAARWVCHVTDCGPAELQRHMEHCKRSVLPLLMERKLPDKGSVMIDDVSLVQHSDNHSTCAEFFRASCEAGELYMSQRNSWLPLQKYYTVLASNNAPGEHNTRLLRHLLVLCCAEVELEAVFEQKLLAHCNVMTPDIANDLSLVTLNLARVCAHMLKQAQGSAEYSTELGMDMKHLTPADKLFLHLNTTMPPSVIADCLLSRVARGLDSMAGTYSSNDVVRVWDRTIADYFVRHPSFAPVLNAAHEHVTNNLDFQYATFSTFMEKEKLLRSQGMDALVSTLYSTEQALSPTLPISYKLNASGFFDTKSGIYPGISCAETVRDLLLKKHGRDIVPTGVSPDSLAFWTDVLALSAEFTAPRMSAQSPVLFLTGNHPALHRKVLTVAAVDVVAKLEVVRLETNTFSATAAVPQKGKRTFVAVDSDVVETERVVVGDKEPTASAVLSTTTTSPQFESQLSLQAAVTATFLEAFLTDPIVLRRLKYRNEQAALEASIKGISVIAAPNPNTLLTTAQLAILAKEVPAELFQIIERAVQKYESIDSSALFSEDSAASDKSDRRMVIWHLNVAKDFCHTPNAWVFLLETLELRSAPMLHVLHSMGAALDPAASRSMRNIVQEYVARQRFAVSLDDCSPRAIEETVRDLGRIPRFSPTISVLPCYETYESCEKDLFHLVGAELAAKLLDHVNRYATACHDKLTSAHKPVLAGAVTSNVYSSASVETILTLFGRMMQCGEDSWARALRKSVLQHAAGSLSEEESATLRAATEVTEIALPSELAHSHGASPNQDESDTAQVAVATAKESLSSHTTDLCDLSILGDAVLCVLHSRYCAVLVDEHAPPHDPTGFATLAEGIHHLGLSTTLPVSVAPSAAVLAVVETLLHKCAESTTTTTTSSEGTAISLDSSAADVAENSRISSLVRTARSLPVTSHLRDLLAAICVSMLTDQPIHLVDHSFLTVLALVDLLGLNVTSMSAETLWTNSHFLTLNLYPPYGDSAREENHIPGAIKSENISLRRLQSHSAPPPSKHAVSIVLPAHTMVMSDLLLLRLLQTDGTFCSSDTLRGNWHSHDTGGADKPGELEMTAQQYSQQWDGVLQSMHKPVHALSALMQALVTIPSTQGLVFLGVWSEYKLLLSHAGAGATAAGPVSDAGDRLKTSSAGVILSRSVQSLLTWLPNMLTDWELHAVLLSALLSLHLDTATASGQIMAQRVLQSMRVARHECIGIVPINDSDEAESDAGSESSSSVGAVSLHERSDEDVSDAEDTSDNFRLSENTLAVLKQSLLLIAQALESFAKTHGVKVTVRASSVLVQVAESSLSIVSELRKNIEDW